MQDIRKRQQYMQKETDQKDERLECSRQDRLDSSSYDWEGQAQ